MHFVCEQCAAKYRVEDQLVAGKGHLFRCRRCSHRMTVQDLRDRWYLSVAGVSSGPFLLEELVEQHRAGSLPTTALFWKEGLAAWQPREELSELARVLPSLFPSAVVPVRVSVSVPPSPPTASAQAPDPEEGLWGGAKPRFRWGWVVGGFCCLLFGVGCFWFWSSHRSVGEELPAPPLATVPRGEAPTPTPPTFSTSSPHEALAAHRQGQGNLFRTPNPPPAVSVRSKDTPFALEQAPSRAAQPRDTSLPVMARRQPVLSSLLQGDNLGQEILPPSGAAPTELPQGGGEGLSSDQVSRVVSQHKLTIRRACWERAGEGLTSANLQSRVEINGKGKVTNVRTRGVDGPVANCIVKQIRGWRFPTTGASTTVDIPFSFVKQ